MVKIKTSYLKVILATIIIVLAVFNFVHMIRKSSNNSSQSEKILTSKSTNKYRDVIPREYTKEPVVEVYYGDPQFLSLAEMVSSNHLEIDKEDVVKIFPDPWLGMGFKTTIYRAPTVNLYDGNKKAVVKSWKNTVGEFLTEQKIAIGKDDVVSLGNDAQIENNTEIKITRVSQTTIVENIDLDFKSIKKDDPALDKGKTKITQVGKTGLKQKTYQVRRENGQEVEKKLIEEKVMSQPQDELIVVGTKVVSFGTGVASFFINSNQMIAASNIISRGTKVRVVNLSNGKSVEVTIISAGLRSDRIIDLSTAAFEALGVSCSAGLIKNVRLEKIE